MPDVYKALFCKEEGHSQFQLELVGQRAEFSEYIMQAFADILATNETFSAPMEETYRILGMEPSSVTSLEDYLKEYYGSILKKLKEVGASSRQTDFYV